MSRQLYAVNSNTTQNTNPDPHSRSAAQDTKSLYAESTHRGVTGHAHEPTNPQRGQQRNPKYQPCPTLTLCSAGHESIHYMPKHGAIGHAHELHSNRALHGVRSSATKNTNSVPHLHTAAQDTTRIIICGKHAHGGVSGHAHELRLNRPLHGVDSNANQHTNPAPHLHAAAPGMSQIIVCETHTQMAG